LNIHPFETIGRPSNKVGRYAVGVGRGKGGLVEHVVEGAPKGDTYR
jgi:hypothetical protein